MERVASVRCFGGLQQQYTHDSTACGGKMTFSVYLPPAAEVGQVPVWWWLSGLTCTDQNFVTKAGAQRVASALGVAIVAPDTSPRGPDVATDPAGGWDLGQGASWYVDATAAPWARHYQMSRYLLEELPGLLSGLPLDLGRQGISGHSMGGHGALVLALRNPGRFRSVSALAPVVAPTEVPWGKKAFAALLGSVEAGRAWDTTVLVANATERLPILMDQGEADPFLAAQLQPERLRAACAAVGHPLTLRMQPGYDHSYYFVSSFVEDHLRWFAEALR